VSPWGRKDGTDSCGAVCTCHAGERLGPACTGTAGSS
jgi:hypothetical protein